MYCALILTGLFSTSPNWYGANPTIVPIDPISNGTAATSTNSTTPRPSYGWFDLGLSGGIGFFSPIVRPSSNTASAHNADAQANDYYRFSIPWSESHVEVPKRFYVGLGKHQGLGMWVNLGGSASSTTSDAHQSTSDRETDVAESIVKHDEL